MFTHLIRSFKGVFSFENDSFIVKQVKKNILLKFYYSISMELKAKTAYIENYTQNLRMEYTNRLAINISARNLVQVYITFVRPTFK